MHPKRNGMLTSRSQSSSGTACTCAVTEYVYHDRDDYVIQVDYFPLDELKKQFEELLQAYRDYESLYQNPNRRARDDEEDNDRRRSQRKAELAKETFKASFGHRLEQTPTLLSSMTFAHAIHTMLEWASQLVPHERSRESFDTVDQCSARLRGLTSESDDASRRRSRTCWPFIHKIQVYLNAYILSKGLIIADLPGLRDLNSARKAITERYVRKCHQIFVVARIDRASTDESIKEIFELASRAKLTKVDVICTRSEDIQMREARHDYPRQGGELDEMQDKIDADREEIASLRDDIDDLEEIEDPDQEEERDLLRLQRELRRTEKSLRSHEFELLRFIAQLRNNKVSRSLRDLYRNHSVATALQIFCVSNKVYWEHRENPATEALPYLSFSGILELRRYCIGIVAESRLSAAVSFIKDQIPAFLGSVELWVEAGSGNASAERKQQILDAVSSIECELNRVSNPDFSPSDGIGYVIVCLAGVMDKRIRDSMHS